MAIRPLEMQVSINRTAMVSKAHNTESNSERALLGQSTQREIQREVEHNMNEVVKSGKEKNETNKDGSNKEKYQDNRKGNKNNNDSEKAVKKSNGISETGNFFDVSI